MLKFQIEYKTGITPFCDASPKNRHLDFQKWLEREVSLSWEGDDYDQTDLVIGFELSKAHEHSLCLRGIPFINFDIDPIRFMPDLCIRVLSHSDHFIFPERWSLDRSEIQFEANCVKASRYFQNGVHFSDGAVLIVGQTRNDRSVIHDGRYQWIGDYCESIRQIYEGRDLYYKEHPYNKDTEEVCELLNAHDVSQFNIYRLLGTDQLSCVVGLSSSVLHEAKYFGKMTHAFLPLHKGVITVSAMNFLSIYFWSQVLSQVTLCNDDYYKVNYRDGMLRIGLGTYWSYDLFYRQDF
jgi:hypothetical protein